MLIITIITTIIIIIITIIERELPFLSLVTQNRLNLLFLMFIHAIYGL